MTMSKLLLHLDKKTYSQNHCGWGRDVNIIPKSSKLFFWHGAHKKWACEIGHQCCHQHMHAGVGVGKISSTPTPTPAKITDSDRLRLRLRLRLRSLHMQRSVELCRRQAATGTRPNPVWRGLRFWFHPVLLASSSHPLLCSALSSLF